MKRAAQRTYPVLVGLDVLEPAKEEAADEHDQCQEQHDAREQEHAVKALCNTKFHGHKWSSNQKKSSQVMDM